MNFSAKRLIQKINKYNLFQYVGKSSNRKKTLLAFLTVTIIILSLIRPVMDNINDKRILEHAKQQFIPLIYSEIAEAKIDRTLVELQKALDRLRNQYVEDIPDYQIIVHLFYDRQEYIEKTGMLELSDIFTLQKCYNSLTNNIKTSL